MKGVTKCCLPGNSQGPVKMESHVGREKVGVLPRLPPQASGEAAFPDGLLLGST